ncbi:hypothetical protein V8G54_027520 [Vigna mungo]|uniref:ribonuclease P n=1 Tax=Vigna mungo TaxID=3915 RepID=A0AAQ3N2G1_VIGMU
MENPKKKKKTSQNTEAKFQFELNSCSKAKDLRGAISLYDDAVLNNTRLNQHHFNALLYLCSNSVADQSLKTTALDYGFRAFRHMSVLGVVPNEASVTAVARLAAAKVGEGHGQVQQRYPELRTYDPALFCFCEMLDADKAYEEAELAALLKVSARSGRADNVYEYLHKLRSCVRCVRWFCGAKASEVGEVEFDVGRVKEGVLRNGGGWHGRGWVGKGDWAVNRTSVGADGHCCCCGEQLVCVDIDDAETEKFAGSVAGLALEREVKANFSEFQAWLEKHDSYEAIVDGANVGLYKQNFADGGFSISQLDCVVKELYNQSGNKWPLVVLHNKRLRGLMENPSSRKLVEEWMNNDALYTTPNGSNDDWYWLFAAVKLRCLLVTNDEMRDHIFELIGSNFFNQWKERHQVIQDLYGLPFFFLTSYLVFFVYRKPKASDASIIFIGYPGNAWTGHSTVPSGMRLHSVLCDNFVVLIFWYSRGDGRKLGLRDPILRTEGKGILLCSVSESEKGYWHVPLAPGTSSESSTCWLCITRPSGHDAVATVSNGVSSCLDSQVDENNATSISGKRKERSPPS